MSGRRKRKQLTLQDKVNILKEIDTGKKQKDVAE